MSERQLILVGGGAGTGKSTLAASLARSRGCGWLQLDTLWLTVMEAAGRGSALRTALDVDARLRHGNESPEQLLAAHITASETLCAALPGALTFELQTHRTLVVDGAWLLPGFIAALDLPGVTIRPVVLHEPDRNALRAAMVARRDRAQVAPWHARSVGLASAYGDWLAGEARAHGLPVLTSRPWSTLPTRFAAEV